MILDKPNNPTDRHDEQERHLLAHASMTAHHEHNAALDALVEDQSLPDAEKIRRLRWSLAYALDMIDWLEFDARNGCLRDTRPDHATLGRYLAGEHVGIYVGEDAGTQQRTPPSD